jgi:hypothetical protein
LGALGEQFKWLFLLFIFLGGISIHVSEALLAHMFEINMTWGATAKVSRPLSHLINHRTD